MRLFSRFPRMRAMVTRTPFIFAAALAVSVAPLVSTTATADAHTDAGKYYGYWNYDQPDDSTLNNVSVLACSDGGGACDQQLPLPLKVPQVGWELFSPGPNGTVNGTSDQGCTWNFKVTPKGLELSSTTQQCFNPTVGSAGNLTKWSVQVDGNRETEQITAVSHQPNGVDLIGTMKSGSRHKVVPGQDNGIFVHQFLGDYTRNPADMHTLVNVVATDKGNAYPEQGMVRYTADNKNRDKIVAHTPDGCDWNLTVHGDTAELDPGTQTCHTAKGDLSLFYWAAVTDDGQHINDFRAGTVTAPGQPLTHTYLYSGALARSAATPGK